MNTFKVPFHKSLQGRIVGSLLLIALIIGLGLSAIAYESSRSSMEVQVFEQLTSIADLKKEQIVTWIEERRSDVRSLANNKLNQEHFAEIISPEVTADRKAEYLAFTTDNLIGMQESRIGYESIVIVDLHGTVILSTDSTLVGYMLPDRVAFENTLVAPGGEFVEDIHIQPDTDITTMEFGHVLYAIDPDTGENLSVIIGVAIISVDMGQTIYPLIRAWPGMGASGETLLIRAEGDSTLFLNDLRFEENAALNLSVPVTSSNAFPAHMSSRGSEGIIETPDYRGVQVLAAYRHIPSIGWGFVAKQDTAEAFAPVTDLTRRLTIATILLLLTAGLISFALSRTLTRPLAELLVLTRKVAAGDLTFPVQGLRNDEIGELTDSFQEMVKSLSKREHQVAAANEAARSILGTLYIDDVLEQIATVARNLTKARYAAVGILDEQGRIQHFLPIGLTEAEKNALGTNPGPKGFGLLRDFSDENNLLRTPDLTAHPKSFGFPDGHPTMHSLLRAPIIGRERTLGILYVTEKIGSEEFSQSDEDAIVNLATYAAVALENARLFNDLEASYEFTLDGLIAALDARDKETKGHSHRVVAYTIALSRQLNIPEDKMTTIRRGALLHDIGKIGVPDMILHKPGPLDAEEWAIMRRHPELGHQILSGINYLEDAANIVYSHHERWDGAGYPSGQKGETIPLGARIFAVADSFDAITSDRPYRAGRSYEVARKEIQDGSGSQYDPQVVNAFLDISEEEWSQVKVQSSDNRIRRSLPSLLTEFSGLSPLPPKLNALNLLIGKVSGSLDLDLVLRGAADAAIDLLGAAACGLFLYDAETDSLHLAADNGLPPELKNSFEHFPVKGFHNEVVVREGKIRVLGDPADVPGFVELDISSKHPEWGEYLCVPLKNNGEVNGILGVFCRRPNTYSDIDLQLYQSIGEHIGLAIAHARTHESVQILAGVDELTGAHNRRYLKENLERELQRCTLERRSVSLVMVDIDNFKEYNDQHGHLAGDIALQELVILLRQHLRPADIVTRYGGDEFVLLLPSTELKGAELIVQRVRTKIQNHRFPKGRLSVSMGIAECDDQSSLKTLIAIADKAMYAAKENGGNLVYS